MTPPTHPVLVPVEHIAQSILVLRGQRVLLDSELAALYGVTTKRFNEQVNVTWRAFQRISCSGSARMRRAL